MLRKFPAGIPVMMFMVALMGGLVLSNYQAEANSERHHDGCDKPPANVPAALAVPADECVVEAVEAEGVQIYSCVNAAWVLKAPEANLSQHGRFAGNHFLGPTWQWKDGSKVKAAKTAASPGATPADVALLLLTVTKGEGKGDLEGVQHIQRLATVGGSPPAAACAGTDDLVVPYKASYFFYRAKKHR